ncbi:MAG: helix-turn-helix domain-containing protein, partial [Candidatus Binatia bacterium]
DLYYRLNVVPINLPALRERKEDIPLLANYFLQRCSEEAKKSLSEITPQAMEKMTAHDWPGNVRELANVIERAVVLAQGAKIAAQDLPARIGGAEVSEQAAVPQPYRKAVEIHKRQVILRALAETQGNRVAAAKLLGLQRTYLSRLIKTLRIS